MPHVSLLQEVSSSIFEIRGSSLSYALHKVICRSHSSHSSHSPMEVSFLLKMLADGSAQGMDLCLGDPDATAEPVALRDGTTITATVKSFNDTRGFGFLKIPGANMDLYFHGRDMDEASQGLLMLVGAAGLSNCNATCRVEARADGRWNGRNVSLLEAGVQMMDGMKMAGMIRYFYDHKGFGLSGCTCVGGFINVTGNPIDIYFQGRDVGPDAQMRCEEMGAEENYSDSYGWDGWDGWDGWGSGGSMDYGGGKGSGKGSGKASLPKVEKQIIPGCELVGRLKSYNAEKNFGFISVDGQPNDVSLGCSSDLVESFKSQVDTLGPDGSGLSSGALVKFSLQLMPGGGRLRARDMSLSPTAALSTAAADPWHKVGNVEAAVQKAAAVAHEAIIPGTGSILHDGAEVSGKVKNFNQDRGFGFITVDADETDLYFNVKDLLPEEQQKVTNGLKLLGSRVWFWAEMLDGSRWRCHDISLSFRRAPNAQNAQSDPNAPPAKRQKQLGLDGCCRRARPESERLHVTSASGTEPWCAERVRALNAPNLLWERPSGGTDSTGSVPGSRTDDKKSEGSQPVARTLSSALRQMSWNFASRQDETLGLFRAIYNETAHIGARSRHLPEMIHLGLYDSAERMPPQSSWKPKWQAHVNRPGLDPSPCLVFIFSPGFPCPRDHLHVVKRDLWRAHEPPLPWRFDGLVAAQRAVLISADPSEMSTGLQSCQSLENSPSDCGACLNQAGLDSRVVRITPENSKYCQAP
eukprot:s1361_g9.t1